MSKLIAQGLNTVYNQIGGMTAGTQRILDPNLRSIAKFGPGMAGPVSWLTKSKKRREQRASRLAVDMTPNDSGLLGG